MLLHLYETVKIKIIYTFLSIISQIFEIIGLIQVFWNILYARMDTRILFFLSIIIIANMEGNVYKHK